MSKRKEKSKSNPQPMNNGVIKDTNKLKRKKRQKMLVSGKDNFIKSTYFTFYFYFW